MKNVIATVQNLKRITESNLGKWTDGEWDNEPDRITWVSPTGLYCHLSRNMTMGFLCGYVGIMPGHPLYGKHYDDMIIPECCDTVELTFADSLGIEHTSVNLDILGSIHWVGFDCAHMNEYMPGMAAVAKSIEGNKNNYRNVFYVETECEKLATFFAEVTNDN